MCNKIKLGRAAIALQETSRLLQHLFYFVAGLVSCAIK